MALNKHQEQLLNDWPNRNIMGRGDRLYYLEECLIEVGTGGFPPDVRIEICLLALRELVPARIVPAAAVYGQMAYFGRGIMSDAQKHQYQRWCKRNGISKRRRPRNVTA